MTGHQDAAVPLSVLRRCIYAGTAIVLSVCVGLVGAETYCRIAKPKPAVQVVRGYGLHSVDGVPVWEYSSDRYNRICVEQHPERTRVLFLGSSITFGTGLPVAEVFTTGLEARLNQVRPTPGFCVLNFAQAGFSFEQKLAVARAEVPRYKPALIMWEDWQEWFDYSFIGDAAYGTTHYALRPDGFIGVMGVPDVLNHFLFLHSRLYEYFALVFGTRSNRTEEHYVTKFVHDRLMKVEELTQSVGAKLALYLTPPLDRPFPDLVAHPPLWHQVIFDFAHAHGIPAYLLQRELIDQNYLEVREEPCCHYNAAGHRALVPIMERIVLEQLDGKPPPAPS